MPILNTVRDWWASRRQHEREAYDHHYGHAAPEEAAKLKELKKPMRYRFKILGTRGMPDGTGMSPNGTPIDFTADEKPPRY